MRRRDDMRHGREGRADIGRLSYKFQRLREEIRAAIETGALQGRLPGERELARRYHANAKTVNKALRDLSREGLLIRHIGLGTFVANGRSAAAGRRKVFRCFESGLPGESLLRRALMPALRRELADRGHGLEAIRVDPSRTSVEATPADWPSRLRRATDGLYCLPDAPLSRASGRPSEALILDAQRRQVPLVLLGAMAAPCKVNAAVPDYVDAGFRLSEHLFRSGCGSVAPVTAGEGREVEAVLAGCLTAAARQGGHVCASGSTLMAGGPDERVEAALRAALEAPPDAQPAPGLLLIGHVALQAALACDELMRRRRAGEIRITCVPEIGDSTAAERGITAYEVEVDRIASWGARLLTEQPTTGRPLEVLVPGVVRVREPRQDAAPPRSGARRDDRPILAEVTL